MRVYWQVGSAIALSEITKDIGVTENFILEMTMKTKLWSSLQLVTVALTLILSACGEDTNQSGRLKFDVKENSGVYGKWQKTEPDSLANGRMDLMYVIQRDSLSVEAKCKANDGSIIYASTTVTARITSDRIIITETKTATNRNSRYSCSITLPVTSWPFTVSGNDLEINRESFRRL
jgi:hypothetical protein